MVCFPNAKINLGLKILNKREDGYHNLEGVFYPIGLQDVLEVIENQDYKNGKEKIVFSSSGISIPGDYSSNLSVKAYHLISNNYDLPPVKVHLFKNIPIGAGLGGGSADGAFAIKLLNTKFDLGLSKDQMLSYSEKLGSDCPFFISNKPAFVSGRGEVLEDLNIDLSSYWLVLVNPGIHIGTKEAYEMITPKPAERSIKEIINLSPDQWTDVLKNDFELPISQKYPAIGSIKQTLYNNGALYASMTGSGSSVYGIFKNEPEITFTESYFVWKGKMQLAS